MAETNAANTLYIIYNASGSLTGKLIYGYRKLTSPKPTLAQGNESEQGNSGASCDAQASTSAEPVCAACDITHGGLSLRETSAWVEAKKSIIEESKGVLSVVQLHRDEVPEDLRAFVKQEGIRYPSVILRKGSGAVFSLVLDSKALASCNGDAQSLVNRLRDTGLFQEQASL